MLITIDRIFVRLRSARPADDRGATLVLVVALMAVGFIVSSLIVSACLFAIQQTSHGRANVQAFAAAEAGRDSVVAALTADAANCNTADPRFTGTDPGFEVTVYGTEALTQPTGSSGLTASCPDDDSTFVVLRSEGESVSGGTTTIESVYTWVTFSERVAGGGLGFMDAAYTALAVDYSGDIVVRHGDFTCGAGTTVDGSVYVLDGRVIVPQVAFFGTSCTITGDVISSAGIEVQNGILGDSHLNVGGNIQTSGSIAANDPIDAGGDVEVGGTITAASSGRLTTHGGAIKPDGTTAVGNIRALGNITASGVIETTTGSIMTNGAITATSTLRAASNVTAAQSITATGSGRVQATGGAVTAGTSIAANNTSTVTGAGITATTNISAAGTVEATSTNIVAGGTITAGGTIRARGDVRAVGAISTATGLVQATTGSILSRGAITVTGATGALTAGAQIAAGGLINATGTLTAATVTAVTTITSVGTCTVSGNITAGTTVSFTQRKPTIGAGYTCTVGGDIRAAGTGQSTLAEHTTSPNRPSQVFARAALARGTWLGARYYRDTNGSPVNVAALGTPGQTSVTAPAAPSVTAPVAPAAFTLTAADYPELYLRTRWVDLGKTTAWNGYDAYYALASSECGSSTARNRVTNLLQTSGSAIVIDATACNSISITGWTAVNLRRDAVLLVNNITLQLIRFSQTGATAENPRQLFIVQADDNLTLAPPVGGGEPEPQPHCGGRSQMNIWGSGWGGLANWDPNVRVLLYSPCGSTNSSALSEWRGHLYVANNSATTDIISSVECAHMWVTGTFDLPCSINDFGEWSGVHTIDGKRIGDRTYQTEP